MHEDWSEEWGNATARRLAKGEVLFWEGDPSDSLLRIDTGAIQLYRKGRPFVELGPGALLGEASIFVEGARTLATARAAEPTTIRVLDRDQLRILRSLQSPTYDRLLGAALRTLAERIDAVDTEVLDRLERDKAPASPSLLSRIWARFAGAGGEVPDPIPVLERLPRIDLTGASILSGAGDLHFVAADTALVLEEDPSKGIFVVISGQLKVVRSRDPHTASELARVGVGGVVGAHATLRDAPRGATLVATEPTWVMEFTLDALPPAGRRALSECLATVLRAQLADANALLAAARDADGVLSADEARAVQQHVEAWLG